MILARRRCLSRLIRKRIEGQAWLIDVLARPSDYPAKRIDELVPQYWKTACNTTVAFTNVYLSLGCPCTLRVCPSYRPQEVLTAAEARQLAGRGIASREPGHGR